MAKTVLGIFQFRENATDAIDELKDLGYDTKNLSIVMKDAREAAGLANSTGATVANGAVTGAATGAVIGGLAGLLVGVGAIAVPGLGALLVGGPLAAVFGLTGAAATTASGAATGALAGGLLGALVSLGIPEEQARQYEERIRAGGILLAVPTIDRREAEVVDILQECGAVDIQTLALPEERAYRAGSATFDDEEDLYSQRKMAYGHHRTARRRRL